jgi:hypothetical protein
MERALERRLPSTPRPAEAGSEVLKQADIEVRTSNTATSKQKTTNPA